MDSALTDENLVDVARQALNVEIEGLRAQLPRLGADFARACRICLDCRGRIVVTGMGKSGHIAGKIADMKIVNIPQAGFSAHFSYADGRAQGQATGLLDQYQVQRGGQ